MKSTYIIAEIGNNHNGSLNLAKRLIKEAKYAGANCVKFQIRNLSKIYSSNALNKRGTELGVEYHLDLLKKYNLDLKTHEKIFQYCNKIHIDYLASPWDNSSLKFLKDLGCKSVKFSSADFTNLPLIQQAINFDMRIFFSTGMTYEKEIDYIVNFLKKKKFDNYYLLHCNSTYPTPNIDINLNYLQNLKRKYPNIGYSGHERGINISIASITFGCKVIERHLTLNKNLEGPDHESSLLPIEFKNMVYGIRELEVALGPEKIKKRIPSQGELINRISLSKSIVASRSIPKNKIIEKKDLSLKSPSTGISGIYLNDLIGKKILQSKKKDDLIFHSDFLKNKLENYKKIKFVRKTGIPTRFHDYKKFMKLFDWNQFIEFHLSYKDLEKKNFQIDLDKDYYIHVPELFKNSELLDLMSPDEKYRKRSVSNFNSVINFFRERSQSNSLNFLQGLITNIGGFSTHKRLNNIEKLQRLKQFEKSLREIDELELFLPQTMAPFPWHFGGQRYQNFLYKPEDIVFFGEKFNLKFCLDISHASLACEHLNLDIFDYIDKTHKFIKYLHIADSKKENGEGLQIDNGDIDFKRLSSLLNTKLKYTPFIPEIWQGHDNNGEGFYKAFKKLHKHGLR